MWLRQSAHCSERGLWASQVGQRQVAGSVSVSLGPPSPALACLCCAQVLSWCHCTCEAANGRRQLSWATLSVTTRQTKPQLHEHNSRCRQNSQPSPAAAAAAAAAAKQADTELCSMGWPNQSFCTQRWASATTSMLESTQPGSPHCTTTELPHPAATAHPL